VSSVKFYPTFLADASLSVHTLSMMDSAILNLARGKVGPTLDPHEILGVDEESDS
jgi:hypothetical protein